MSLMNDSLSFEASLHESRKFIKQTVGKNSILRSQAMEELESIEAILSPITTNPSTLVTAMIRCGAMIGGPNATSFFYPICEMTGCPWYIFCHKEKADTFVNTYRNSSGADFIEDTGISKDSRVVHFRKSNNGMEKACNVSIYISERDPLESILNLKNSYDQTAISGVGAICFWPKLQSNGMYRVFDSNTGLMDYPKGNTFHQTIISPGKRAIMKKSLTTPSIYSGVSSREEIVVFKNVSNIDNVIFSHKLKELQNIVYSVFNSSSKYLGHTADMK